MAYVEEFRSQIEKRDFSKMMQLWQEYCLGDQIDGQEIIDILSIIKNSDFSKPSGQYVEGILPLALAITDEELKTQALTLIVDLQTTNSQPLFELAVDFVKSRYEKMPHFNEKMRLVGLRTKDNFQGALSAFALLNHFEKGSFIFHTAGWGVGKIIDCSFLREQLTVEFENLGGSKRDLLFKNAFKTAQLLSPDHFLALRYEHPEQLEKLAKENPIRLIHKILIDLGPKTASEIKDLLVDVVIEEDEYSKWWQNTRSKLKKEPLIDKPEHLKEPYSIRSEGIKNDHLVEKALKGKKTIDEVVSALYTLTREFPELLKESETKNQIVSSVESLLTKELALASKIKAHLFLDAVCGISTSLELAEEIKNLANIEQLVLAIDIQLLKRRLLLIIKSARTDWADIFGRLILGLEPSQLKDFALKELCTHKKDAIAEKSLLDLADRPIQSPTTLIWFFQRQIDGDSPILNDQASREKFMESFLVLMHQLEKRQNQGDAQAKELVKKMYSITTDQRFHTVRILLKDSSEQFAREFTLLASKCHTFTDQDQKIIKSLVEVAHPSLSKNEPVEEPSYTTFWTTAEGYEKVKKRIEQIGTTEMVENAREIEAARALGDLRENSEYKFALERRSRLQSDLKRFSEEFNQARVITKDDIDTSSVGIGTRVTISDGISKKTYTILGPWDADPDTLVLSIQSKLAQAMLGKKKKESFSFKDEKFTIEAISSYLE